jgi:hypothetical protein
MPIWKLSLVVFAFAAFGSIGSVNAQSNPSDWAKQTAAQIEDKVETKHPAAYFVLAAKKFEEGKRDEATFWLYAGQIRYRAYLLSNPKLDPSGDPALFTSLMQQIGRPINEYAFGDIPQLVKIIDRALEWDAKNPDPFTKKSPTRDEVRDGLVKLKERAVSERDYIREQRKKNGFENRS